MGLDIVIASGYYWPETAGVPPLVAGPAEYLAGRGHRVVVLAGFPHYPSWRPLERRRAAVTDEHEGVSIRRRWHYVPRTQTALRRAVYEGTLVAGGLTSIPIRPRPDVVIGVIPTFSGGVLAAATAAAHRRPYGLLIQDVMGSAADQSGVRGGSRVAGRLGAAELALARRAAGVGVIASGFRRYFEQGGVPPERIVTLRNPHYGPEPSETVAEARARLGWDLEDFVCLHAGNMGHKQGLDNVVRAGGQLAGRGVRVVLGGDGNDRPRLERLAAELGTVGLSFASLQAPGQFESMLRAADVLLINQRATVTDMALPSKLVAYFKAGRPVVAAVAENSETAREIMLAGAGLVVAPEDPEALTKGILSMRENPQAAARHGESGRLYAQEHLEVGEVLDAYERWIVSLVRAR